MRDLSDHAVRVALGISRKAAAKLAGVAPNTLTLYEVAPQVIRPTKRAALERLYTLLRDVLQNAPGMAAPSTVPPPSSGINAERFASPALDE